MSRMLLAAILLVPTTVYAQSSSPPEDRTMPTYQDDDAQWKGGYSDSYGTADLHHHVDQTPAPPPVPDGYGAYDAPPVGTGQGGWQTPQPYAREDQVDQGSPNDAAHRADRARTADLNRRPHSGYNAGPATGGNGSYAASHAEYQAELARHARDMQAYRDQQSQYSERVARWRARADACEHGDPYACEEPR